MTFENFIGISDDQYSELRAQCGKCFGLCCVALYFAAAEGFPEDKEAGQPCINLDKDFRCCVHKSLKERGLKGCLGFDCFGAGPKVAQISFAGHDWRHNAKIAQPMFEVYLVMRQLHEMMWYLTEAITLQATHPIHEVLNEICKQTERLTYLSPDRLLGLDVAAHRTNVNSLLQKTSEFVRAEVCRNRAIPSRCKRSLGLRPNLMAADVRKVDLQGANLRGACLIAADLRGLVLKGTDFIGADFRDADIRGADLSESIFLTQAQINAATGDGDTRLPSFLIRPIHWVANK